jgi:hypothetical protein
MLTLDLDLALLSGQIERYVRDLGMDGPTVVKNTARLLLLQLIKLTPPKSLKQGRAAIARDLRNALGLIDERKIKREDLRTALKSGDAVAVNAILRRVRKGPLDGLHAQTFSKELHTGKRNSRGRVRSRQGILAVTPARARKYLKEVQSRSGQAKGAFVPALKVVGGKAPGWVERHQGKFGDVSDVHLGAGEKDPRITAINSARGIRSLDQSDVSKAIRFRGAAMSKNISNLLRVRAKQHNLA